MSEAKYGARIEVVPGGRAIWQPENAKTYLCPACRFYVFSQYQGEASPRIVCSGGLIPEHRLEWDDA